MNDLKFVLRQLMKNPGLTVVVVFAPGLSRGAARGNCTAIVQN